MVSKLSSNDNLLLKTAKRKDRRPEDYGHSKFLRVPMSKIFEWAERPSFRQLFVNNGITAISYVPNGGLIPAAVLNYALSTRGPGRIHIVELGLVNPTNPGLLIVEDIIDSGATVAKLIRQFPEAKFTAVYRRASCPAAVRERLLDWCFIADAGTWIEFPWEPKSLKAERFAAT